MKKKIWLSKTFWVNALTIGAMVAREQAGIEISAEAQVSLLAAINIVLRLVTRQPVAWN